MSAGYSKVEMCVICITIFPIYLLITQHKLHKEPFNNHLFPFVIILQRTWRKIWMVLFKPSPTGVGRVELCAGPTTNAATDGRKVGRQKSSERKVVRLSDCLSVDPAANESCPPGCTAFYLHTIQCTYTLASTASQDWLSALCSLAFQVINQGNFAPFSSCNGRCPYHSGKVERNFPHNQR